MSIAIQIMTLADFASIVSKESDPTGELAETVSNYEPEEFQWFITNNSDVVLVAKESDRIYGYLFCKLMSPHWGMVDGFYVCKPARRRGVGKALLKELEATLKSRCVDYISVLIDPHEESLHNALVKLGFIPNKSFRCLGKILDPVVPIS